MIPLKNLSRADIRRFMMAIDSMANVFGKVGNVDLDADAIRSEGLSVLVDLFNRYEYDNDRMLKILRSALRRRIKRMYKYFLYSEMRAHTNIQMSSYEDGDNFMSYISGFDVDAESVLFAYKEADPEQRVLAKDTLRKILKSLTIRERKILKILMEEYPPSTGEVSPAIKLAQITGQSFRNAERQIRKVRKKIKYVTDRV